MRRRAVLCGIGVLAAGGLSSAQAQTPIADETARNLATVKRLFAEVYNDANLEHVDQIISPDYVPSDPDLAPGIDAYRARQETSIADFAEAYTSYTFVIDDMIARDNVVAARYTFTAARPDGTQKKSQLSAWYELRDGLITTWV